MLAIELRQPLRLQMIASTLRRGDVGYPVVCTTVVPDHGPKDLGAGLLRAIERDLEPCLGKDG
jgi:hypothetical protein